MKMKEMRYELVESRENPGEWRVEAFNMAGDGECYLAIFTGPLAKERAEEYLYWKLARLAEKSLALHFTSTST